MHKGFFRSAENYSASVFFIESWYSADKIQKSENKKEQGNHSQTEQEEEIKTKSGERFVYKGVRKRSIHDCQDY